MGFSAFRDEVAQAAARAAIAANTIPGGADNHTDGGGTAGRVMRRRKLTFSQIIADTTRGVDGEGRGAGAPAGQQKLQIKVGGDPVATNFNQFVKAEAIDAEHGLVFGWAIVCKVDGKPYVDVQGDEIPEDAMLEAAADFAKGARPGNEMHAGSDKGQYIFTFPLTTEIAKAFGIETTKTGLMVAYKPPPDVLEKYKSREYSGFSVEGVRIKDERSE